MPDSQKCKVLRIYEVTEPSQLYVKVSIVLSVIKGLYINHKKNCSVFMLLTFGVQMWLALASADVEIYTQKKVEE